MNIQLKQKRFSQLKNPINQMIKKVGLQPNQNKRN